MSAAFAPGWRNFARLSGLGALLLCAHSPLSGQATPNNLPPGDGRALLAAACAQCHGLKTITSIRDGSAGWRNNVQEMVLRGAQLTPAETDALVQYLTKNFGPGSPATPPGAAQEKTAAVSLPSGPGKELVESRCIACHDLERIATAKRTKDDWDRIVNNMVTRGATATPDEVRTILSYLAAQFGK
jgi:mono/diheme cytochrome c family protein